eukprot:CAMPEP_0174713176 /NCGR_PEP_ID=MMETSP1094-20130205/13943_1 /TAXON_ID=156173 /ORGANISM="Chrysochromulina brevifilum, Strain UTEX LB 985" /LENGTH=61 /DNA_ID=CAMNT_0015912335 /DNA_START=64 /DNA_END=247 /DNA_ORIENTATION=+
MRAAQPRPSARPAIALGPPEAHSQEAYKEQRIGPLQTVKHHIPPASLLLRAASVGSVASGV